MSNGRIDAYDLKKISIKIAQLKNILSWIETAKNIDKSIPDQEYKEAVDMLNIKLSALTKKFNKAYQQLLEESDLIAEALTAQFADDE